MPIAVKDYTWEQSADSVFISVPLKGVFPSKVDIITTENYIKVCTLSTNIAQNLTDYLVYLDLSLLKERNGGFMGVVHCDPSKTDAPALCLHRCYLPVLQRLCV